jgi:hypothetical protein
MKIQNLQRLFEKLPLDFMDDLKDIDFKTCWYGSAGIDKRPMELLDPSHPYALIKEPVKVFFYTDIDYVTFFEKFLYFDNIVDFENGNDVKKGLLYPELFLFQKRHRDLINQNALRQRHLHKFENKYFSHFMIEQHKQSNWKNADEILSNAPESITKKLYSNLSYQLEYILNHGEISFDEFNQNYQFGMQLVKHQAHDGSNIYCFYIDCDDCTFERLLIKEKMKINYVVNNGGWAGPGPRCLGNLQVEYGIGGFIPIDEVTDFEIIPYSLEHINEFVYREHNNHLTRRDFYKIHF